MREEAPTVARTGCRYHQTTGSLATVSTVLDLLAIAGGAAAAWHLVRAALRFLRGGAWRIWADEMGRTHARHGDLTSLEESRQERADAAREGRLGMLESAAWLALLIAPSFTAWPRALYAAYSLLWIGPAARRLARAGKGAE